MNKKFIKIADPDTASYLVALGFQYTKEQNVFAFHYSEELLLVLQRQFSQDIISESKLRF